MDTAITPQALQRRQRRTLLRYGAALAALLALAGAINWAVRPSIKASQIMLAEVRLGDIANTLNASGMVIPVHEELLPSPIQTRVAKVHAKLGQTVAAGELLLELDDHTIRLAQEGLREELAQQENRIGVLALELAQKRKQLRSQIELLELDLKSARAKRERYATLRLAGAVSGEDMLTAELNVERVGIQLRQQKELIADTQLLTSSAIEGARLQKSLLQKRLDQQQLLLDRTRVRAPFAGVLSMLAAEEGTSLASGQLMARVSEPNNYRIEASLSDFHARSLNPGQAVRVLQGEEILAGRVHTILPEIQNGTIKLLVALDQPSHPQLRNKMRVEVHIVTDQKTGVLVAPTGPAFNGKGRQMGFVVKDGVARKTMLDLGNGDGKAVEIVAGARVGDQLIISGIGNLKQHDTIRISH